MNGDGLPDRVVFDRLTPQYKTWKVYFNNGSGFDNGTDWSNPSAWSYYYGNYIRNTGANGTYTDLIDMNGDGLPDRVVYSDACFWNYTGNCPWKVYFNNGNGLSDYNEKLQNTFSCWWSCSIKLVNHRHPFYSWN
jgi:phage-related protein